MKALRRLKRLGGRQLVIGVPFHPGAVKFYKEVGAM